jgi:ketosteroid isomerase-like protein
MAARADWHQIACADFAKETEAKLRQNHFGQNHDLKNSLAPNGFALLGKDSFMKWTWLLLFAAHAAVAQNPDSASALFELRQAEQSFAMMSASHGRQAAFAEFIAEEGVIFRGDAVITNGKQYWQEQRPQPIVLKWEPEFQDVAASGDYGYSLGPWEFQEYRPYTAPLAYGYFLSVWQKQSDGRWQAILDTGTGGGMKRENHTLTYSFPPNADKPKSYQPVKDLAAAKAELYNLDHALMKTWSPKPRSETLLAMLAPDARVMRRGHAPLTNLDSINTVLKADTVTFNWQALDANAAPSGDMGFTYGVCEFRNKEGRNQKTVYVRIWKRQVSGEWKVVVDLLHLGS